MKAAVFTAPNTIEFQSNYPEPVLSDGFILRVRASGVCATDIKALSGTRPGMKPPMILGHELSGEILESSMSEFKIGERISIAPYAGCGICDFCLEDRDDLCLNKSFLPNGAFAEKVSVPKSLALKTAWKIPENVSFEEAAMAEPLACVILSLNACRWKPGWSILVVGAGFMGLLHVLVASAWGATKILVAEPNPSRRETAKKIGAVTLDPSENINLKEWATAETNGGGPHVVVTAVGSPEVVESVVDVAKPGGVVHIFGGLPKDRNLSISSYTVHYKSVSLVGTSGFRTRDYRQATQMISDHLVDLKSLISTSFTLEQSSEAFKKAMLGDSIKVIVSQKMED